MTRHHTRDAVWTCSVGPADRAKLLDGADLPMRLAVRRAFREITGEDPEYLFSGWGGEFSPSEQEYIERARA